MRSSKSRSRSKSNRPRSLGNVVNRVFDSSGPEGKVRGTPAQIIEKYQFLARDAQLSNDRVAAENFLQHAEHYTRLLAEAQREQQAEQEARQQYHQQTQGGGRDRDGNRDNRDGGRDVGRDGGRDSNRDGNRDTREGGRDNRDKGFDRNRGERGEETSSGFGPVIGGEENDGGPVETPESGASATPAEAPAENTGGRSRSRRSRGDAGSQESGAQPDLPSFITGAAEPAAAETAAEPAAEPAAPKPPRSRAPRKPRAPREESAASEPAGSEQTDAAPEPKPAD